MDTKEDGDSKILHKKRFILSFLIKFTTLGEDPKYIFLLTVNSV
jgi:hypothetical protein